MHGELARLISEGPDWRKNFTCEFNIPVRPSEVWSKDMCRICWNKFSALREINGSTNSTSKKEEKKTRELPCIHLGSPVVPPPDLSGKDWRHCELGFGAVCPCGACQTCSKYDDGESKEPGSAGTIAVSFKHGLGDAANFAHMIPLYTKRGWKVQVNPGHRDHAPVFESAGAEIVNTGLTHFWQETGNVNKNRYNLSARPMPDIGNSEEIWREYCDVKLKFKGVCQNDIDSVERILNGLNGPIICLHVIGFSWSDGSGSLRNYPPDKTIRLIELLTKSTSGSVVVLDRDWKAPIVNSDSVRYFHDFSPGQLYTLLEKSHLMIGIDSGPINFVRFTDTPAIGIWTNHFPSDYLLPRKNTKNLVASRHADRMNSVAPEWNAVLAPTDGPSPTFIVDHALKTLGMNVTVSGSLRSTSYSKDYYEEHKESGLDYLVFGDWQKDYGKWIVDSFRLKGKTVLDVGCACGAIVRGISLSGAVVQGIDINEHMISEGKKKWPDMEKMLSVCDSCNLHLYKENEWDFIHSSQVAEHWPEKLVSIILEELCRVTKKGGIFFCCLDTEEMFERQGRKKENEDPTHVTIKPMSWWEEKLSASGWEVTKDYDQNLVESKGSFLKKYDWDYFVARKV